MTANEHQEHNSCCWIGYSCCWCPAERVSRWNKSKLCISLFQSHNSYGSTAPDITSWQHLGSWQWTMLLSALWVGSLKMCKQATTFTSQVPLLLVMQRGTTCLKGQYHQEKENIMTCRPMESFYSFTLKSKEHCWKWVWKAISIKESSLDGALAGITIALAVLALHEKVWCSSKLSLVWNYGPKTNFASWLIAAEEKWKCCCPLIFNWLHFHSGSLL